MEKPRFRTYVYNDATISEEWSIHLDGKWPYDMGCYEVVFKIDRNFYRK